jgi:hypothetical protein
MRSIFGVLAIITTASAFAPASTAGRSALFRPANKLSSTQVNLAAAAIPNPLKNLPWNAEKERQREARRLKQESAKLHRELGIAEDSTYEELTDATDALIAKTDGDLKKKVKIEMAKDRILQIRLNARLAGLAEVDKDARAQSTFEAQGADEEDDAPKNQAQEWNAPKWTQGLIVKPDKAHAMKQLKFWGAWTAAGLLFPPALEKIQMFNWLFMIGQLTFRGVNTEDMEGFGMFQRGSGGSHKKVAWLLGVTIWITTKLTIYSIMPKTLRFTRAGPMIVYSIENTVFGLACSYLQPYKG